MSPPTQPVPGPALVLDAWGPRTCVGLLGADEAGGWQRQESGAPALEAIFVGARALLEARGLSLPDLRALLLCSGPGSVLGLRLSAMAVRTWQRLHPRGLSVYQYHGLSLAALAHRGAPGMPAHFTLLTDWKKSAFRRVDSEDPLRIHTIPTKEARALSAPVRVLPQRKSWTAPEPGWSEVSYPFDRLPDFLDVPGFLRAVDAPELPDTESGTYRKWAAERHRAAASGSP